MQLVSLGAAVDCLSATLSTRIVLTNILRGAFCFVFDSAPRTEHVVVASPAATSVCLHTNEVRQTRVANRFIEDIQQQLWQRIRQVERERGGRDHG